MPDEPTINPYNFVPLGEAPVRRTQVPGWRLFGKEACSGRLLCHLIPLGPVFTADHQRSKRTTDVARRELFPFLRNGDNKPIFQGATLKGMVRAVYEALSNSCLALAARSGTSKRGRDAVFYTYDSLGDHDHDRCDNSSNLCPACSLFGWIRGNEAPARGRVAFSDAELVIGTLQTTGVLLPELSAPKPHHHRTYSRTGNEGGPIAGRKFFYHQDAHKRVGVTGEGSPRAKWIAEYASVGTRFDFSVTFQNLSEVEFALLVRSLVLDEGLGHKVGMAKPAGFGSCRIEIDSEGSFKNVAIDRYSAWNAGSNLIDVEVLKKTAGPLPDTLAEVLRLDKHMEGAIGYPSFSMYRHENVAMDVKGRYLFAAAAASRSADSAVSIPEEAPPAKTEPVEQAVEKPERKKVKQGDKVQIEVTAKVGRVFHLRIVDTGQEDFLFHSDYAPWKIGTRLRVRVAAVAVDGLVKKINP